MKKSDLLVCKAQELGCTTIGMLDTEGGSLVGDYDWVLNVENNDAARIQEMCILVGHMICDLIDRFSDAIHEG